MSNNIKVQHHATKTSLCISSDLPRIDPVCCKVHRKKGVAKAFESPYWKTGGGSTASIVVLSLLVVILLVIVIVCVVNVWCCRILSTECSPSIDEDNYFSRKNGENGETPSQFNTRPNTAAVNGNSKPKRPMTSTLRKQSNQVDVIA